MAERGENDAFIEEHVVTLNPVVGLGVEDIFKAVTRVARQVTVQPVVAAQHALKFTAELVRILAGTSQVQLSPQDGRFDDTLFQQNSVYTRLARSWLAWRGSVNDWVESAGFEGEDLERARFVAALVTDAFVPTNFLPGNPAALRKAYQTRGASLVAGLKNLIHDIRYNRGMPSQVDKSAFRVGGNIAVTPGSVIHRDEILELIQYQPQTDDVNIRPVMIVPPQINKYYIYDLSPHKSMVRFLLEAGYQVFMVSWRNPGPEHRAWGLDDYVLSLDKAIDATRTICEVASINVVGACAGGITLAAALGYLSGRHDLDKVASLTLMVNVLQPGTGDSITGLFASEEAIEAARRRSARAGVLDGNDTARVFNWMRPNDLIWNYVVSNYLLGERPPAFDILYWNNDTTRLPARLHSDFLDIFKDNLLTKPGALRVRGVPIDLSKITCPAFVTGGITDHITPWQACYRTTQILGGEATFVLSSAGHIQSLINPPGSSNRKFFLNAATPPSAADWFNGAVEHGGSWWPYWTQWLAEQCPDNKVAPTEYGSGVYRELCEAPGSYVFE